MYRGISTQRSCARAWVAAAAAIIEAGDEGYNIVIDVEDPCNHDDRDNEVAVTRPAQTASVTGRHESPSARQM
jgi:hypothetical protein